GERTYRHRLIASEGNDIERLLPLARILGRTVPHPDIVCPREPFLVLRAEPDYGTALRADEIIAGDADGPAEPRGHADDLVGGVDRTRAPDFGNRLHLPDLSKHLDADHR